MVPWNKTWLNWIPDVLVSVILLMLLSEILLYWVSEILLTLVPEILLYGTGLLNDRHGLVAQELWVDVHVGVLPYQI